MKRELYLLVSVIFFILFVVAVSLVQPTPSTGVTTPPPYANMTLTIVSVVFLCISIMFFTGFYFDYTYTKQKIIGIIPVRMDSSRFPGKPLAKINDKPMLVHIYEACKRCDTLDEVYVATPDDEIMDFCKSIDIKVIKTDIKHERASDRVKEAIERLEVVGEKYDIIVMIQGDEPMITSEMIDKAIEPLLNSDVEVTNLMGYIKTKKGSKDTNTIKVVVDKNNNALYFSRSQIPHNIVGYKQVCIIAFTNSALKQFSTLKPTELEQVESVDMLRFLENDIKVRMVLTDNQTHAIDVPADIKIVEKLMN